MLRYTVLLTMGLMASAYAAEPEWKNVASSKDGTAVLVDVANIKTREKQLTAWVTYNFGTPQELSPNKVYRSTVSLLVYDCESERSGTASTNFYAEPFGAGQVLEVMEVPLMLVKLSYARPGTLGYAVLEEVCSTVR